MKVLLFTFLLLSLTLLFSTQKTLNNNNNDFLTNLFGIGHPETRLKSEKYFSKLRMQSKQTINSVVSSILKKRSSQNNQNQNNELTPVIIIPSLIGNQLRAKLNKTHSEHWYCDKHDSWYHIWVDKFQFIPIRINCFYENFKSFWNIITKKYENYPGVNIETEGKYGTTEGIEYLDYKKTMPVWNTLVEALKQVGYTSGKNLRAHIYDWRLAPPDTYTNPEQFERLKNLIEETYTMNNNKKIAFVSLSMGGIYFPLFLNTYVSQEWKDKYILSYTAFVPPVGGASCALTQSLAFTTGEHGFKFSPMPFRDTVRHVPSVQWLLPTPNVYDHKFVLVKTPRRNYTVMDLEDLYRDANVTEGLHFLKNNPIDSNVRNLKPPGVDYLVIYGYNVTTASHLIYQTNDFNNEKNFEVVQREGDGTVLLESCTYPRKWIGKQAQPIELVGFPNMLHTNAIHDERAIRVFMKKIKLL